MNIINKYNIIVNISNFIYIYKFIGISYRDKFIGILTDISRG